MRSYFCYGMVRVIFTKVTLSIKHYSVISIFFFFWSLSGSYWVNSVLNSVHSKLKLFIGVYFCSWVVFFSSAFLRHWNTYTVHVTLWYLIWGMGSDHSMCCSMGLAGFYFWMSMPGVIISWFSLCGATFLTRILLFSGVCYTICLSDMYDIF